MRYLKKYNESLDYSRDDTNQNTKKYIEREFGFTSTDVEDWIQDILDEYDFEFRVRMDSTLNSLTDTKGKGTYLNAITVELFYPGYSGFITKENHPVSKEQLDFISQRFKEHGFVPRYNDNEKIYYTTTSLSFKFKKTDIKINEEMDSYRDDTDHDVKKFIKKEFGFSSTDVQGWIEDTLDNYWMEFRIRIERNDALMCCISIELFYSNPATFPFGTITKENHPVSQEQIDFLKERLSEYGFNLRFSEDVYYPATCTYLAFRFKKTNI